MIIAIISLQSYPCLVGGIELFNYYLTKNLAKHDNHIYILTTCEHEFESDHITSVLLNDRLLRNATLSVLFDILLNLVKMRKEIDIFHIPYTSNTPLVYPILLAKIFFDIKYIITIHGGGMGSWIPRLPHKLFFNKANAIISVSEPLRKEYEIRSGRSISVLAPLVPFRKSQISKRDLRQLYNLDFEDRVLISLGSIKKLKGSDILLDAFLGLGHSYIKEKKIRLLFAGNGPMKASLEEKIKNQSCQEHVKFLGSVAHSDVPDILALSDIYIIPSLFEGASISLFEAMFNGLPIIGTDTFGINNVIIHKKNGLLFNKNNSRDLSTYIKLLVDDKSLSKQLGLNAKKDFIAKYDYDSFIKEQIEIYKKANGGRA